MQVEEKVEKLLDRYSKSFKVRGAHPSNKNMHSQTKSAGSREYNQNQGSHDSKTSTSDVKLFVYGVDERVSNNELFQEFAKAGVVLETYNSGKGFAFVKMATSEDAQEAIKKFNGGIRFGKKWTVQVARK